jgi:glycosyltransferase involved in cell wall biosynthesis
MTTKISVLICTRDRPETVGQAIESVASCAYDCFDLHVMDQSTTKDTLDITATLATRFADHCSIVYHHLEKPGLSRAYNAGMAISDGAIIACTDDDVIVPANWLSRIAHAFDEDSELGLLYGQVCVPERLAGALGAGAVVPALTWNKRERLFHSDHNYKVWGMGANMAIRRTLLDDVGGFDEAMGGGAPLRSSQDFDFAYRTYRAKYAVLLEPSIAVDHYGARTAEQWPATEVAYGIGDGAFYAKHIRCGDTLALRLFLQRATRVLGHAVYHSVRQRRLVGVSIYGRNLVIGIREASRFGVDRQRRLYRETARSRFRATDANVVTGMGRANSG